MSRRPRPAGPRSMRPHRWVALSVAGALLIIAGVTAAAVWPTTGGARSVADSGTPASSPAPPPPAPASTVSWSAPLGIPEDVSEDERLRIKLSYDLVSVPVDELDRLTSLPGIEVVSPRTLGDTAYAAVLHTDVARVEDALPEVSVTPNQLIHADDDQTPVASWGLDAVDNAAAAQDDHYLFDSTGAGVTAFVVDSGVQADHPDFEGRVDAAAGHDEVGDGRGTEDCNGHGTHVAGTIGSSTYGVAKDVRIVPVRVLGCNRSGAIIDLLYGLLWIYQNNDPAQSVVNMSLGAPQNDTVNNFSDGLVQEGFVVVVSAGNETQDACNNSPASAPETITVGAFDDSRSLAWYSNFGPCVDILAPGSDITSTWIGSTTNTISGTSMSSPHVAGLAVRLLQLHPTWATADVQQALTTAAATGHISAVPSDTTNLVAAIPGVPRIASLTATADPAGLALAWTTNRIGTFTSFALTVTDTTTGREYPVTVSGTRLATVFADVQPGHAYTVSITGVARMPSGAAVTTEPMGASGP